MLAVCTSLLLLSSPAGSDNDDATGAEPPAVLETVPGTTVQRITLSARAMQRLGIETSEVGAQELLPALMVAGEVLDPPAELTLNPGATGLIRVIVSPENGVA